MLQQVLQGKWRSRGSSIDLGVLAESAEADVDTAFFDLHFPIVLAAQREPRPSSTMHQSGFRSPHCMFLYSPRFSFESLGVNLPASLPIPINLMPTSPRLDTTPHYLDILPSIWHIFTPCPILFDVESPNFPYHTKLKNKEKKIGGALRCEGSR
jgi:hypothetical protein